MHWGEDKVAHEIEHSVVHLTDQYCELVETLVRSELRVCCEKWNTAEDDRLVLMDVVL